MIIDWKRDARQDLSLEKWRDNKGIGCVHACPRFGKTRVGLKAIYKRRALLSDLNIIILVPSEIIEKHWRNNITDVTIYTANRAKNRIVELMERPIDLLIVDELHKFTSRDNLKLLRTLITNTKFRLGLTGTYPKKNRTLASMFPVIDTITEKEAIDEGWISDYFEYNIPVTLNDNEKIKYEKYSNLIAETLDLFKGKAIAFNQGTNLLESDFDLVMACYVGLKPHNPKVKYIPGEVFRKVVAKQMGWNRDLDLSNSRNRDLDVYWNPNNIYERCKAFKTFVANRNEILINNKAKLDMVLDIIKFRDVPTIIFNESTEFVNTIAKHLGDKAVAYHSNIKSRPMIDPDTGSIVKTKTGKTKMFGAVRIKRDAIEGIKSGKYKYLVTAKALDEGLDLPELQQVIITGGTTNPIQQTQRSARGKTLDEQNKLKIAAVFNLYVDDFMTMLGQTVISRDKSKLISRQINYTHSVKWVNDLTEITL